jgi:hypothetical protein
VLSEKNVIDTEVVSLNSSNRRHKTRYVDGNLAELSDGSGRHNVGRIMDVNHTGARIWSRTELPENRPVAARVQYNQSTHHLVLRVLWKKPLADGFEYGTQHVKLPEIERSVQQYLTQVLNRCPLSA